MIKALRNLLAADPAGRSREWRAARAKLINYYFRQETLLDFIARVAPHEPPPAHLRVLIDIFQRCRTEKIRALIVMPPRSGKSITVKRALAWWLSNWGADLCCYASYNSDFAADQSRECREIARAAGVQISAAKDTAGHWLTEQGGGLFSAGLNAGITGRGVGGLFVVDDPYANPGDARSTAIRHGIKLNFNQVVRTRLEGFASAVVVHTRWVPTDLIGELAEEGGWELINIPALAQAGDLLGRAPGEPLWPERPQFTRAALEEIRRVDEFGFAALYQGDPVPEGTRMFYGEPRFWDPRKTNLSGCSFYIGVDPATTAKTSADFSAGFAIAVTNDAVPTIYVLDGYRQQVTTPQLCRDLREFQQRNYRASMYVESVGGFKSVPQILHEMEPLLDIEEAPVKGDKRQRAELAASAWNDGRILLPLTDPHLPGATTQPPWVASLLHELRYFTGTGDDHDDQADALAHAVNASIAGESVWSELRRQRAKGV
jgi:predicted phage terminase large subunit-like protein